MKLYGKLWLVLSIFLISPASIYCTAEESKKPLQDLGSPFFGLRVSGGVDIPISDNDLFSISPGVNAFAEFKVPRLSFLYAHMNLGYNYIPVKAETALSLVKIGIGGDFRFNISPRFYFNTGFTTGYYYGSLKKTDINPEGVKGGDLFISGYTGPSFFISPSFSLGLEALYSYYNGLTSFSGLKVGFEYHIPAPKSNKLNIEHIEFDKIFPALYQYYEENPPGKAVLYNQARFPVTDIKASLFIEGYMDKPVEWAVPTLIAAGQREEVNLQILFGEKVLNVMESSKVSAELSVHYRCHNKPYTISKIETIDLYDRNSLTWDDDRKAALFVSEKDPVILNFSGDTVSVINKSPKYAINSNFRIAVGLHSALSAYGTTYVVDPISPYAEVVKDKYSVDFLRFPRQTLVYKAGDCDDLTVLYSALLESVGVQTAFITIPGHIFMAFSLDVTPEESKKLFTGSDDLIFIDDKTWVPVETTSLEDGFVKAWQIGAKKWRENNEKNTAVFYPVHDAWEKYPPVGIPPVQVNYQYPPEDWVLNRYNREITRFVNRELEPKVQKYNEDIKESGGSIKALNNLGTLYARYGFYDEAETEYKKVLESEEYLPTLVNLGNIQFIQKDYAEALKYFERAYRVNPEHPKVLLSLARTYYELERFKETEEYFLQLKFVSPSLSQRFSYLTGGEESTYRAAEYGKLEKEVLWLDE
jgi:hypothetical protein